MPVLNIVFAVFAILTPLISIAYFRKWNTDNTATIRDLREIAAASQLALTNEHEREKVSLLTKLGVHDELRSRVGELERANHELQARLQQGKPFYAAMQENMVAIMTHPSKTFHAADKLLSKVLDGSLTSGDQAALDDMLVGRATDWSAEVTDEERLIAGIFPTIMLLAASEKRSDSPVTSVLVVTTGLRDPKSNESRKSSEAQATERRAIGRAG